MAVDDIKIGLNYLVALMIGFSDVIIGGGVDQICCKVIIEGLSGRRGAMGIHALF